MTRKGVTSPVSTVMNKNLPFLTTHIPLELVLDKFKILNFPSHIYIFVAFGLITILLMMFLLDTYPVIEYTKKVEAFLSINCYDLSTQDNI